jgi:hypothetical protein
MLERHNAAQKEAGGSQLRTDRVRWALRDHPHAPRRKVIGHREFSIVTGSFRSIFASWAGEARSGTDSQLFLTKGTSSPAIEIDRIIPAQFLLLMMLPKFKSRAYFSLKELVSRRMMLIGRRGF